MTPIAQTEKLRQWHNKLADEWAQETARLRAENSALRALLIEAEKAFPKDLRLYRGLRERISEALSNER